VASAHYIGSPVEQVEASTPSLHPSSSAEWALLQAVARNPSPGGPQDEQPRDDELEQVASAAATQKGGGALAESPLGACAREGTVRCMLDSMIEEVVYLNQRVDILLTRRQCVLRGRGNRDM